MNTKKAIEFSLIIYIASSVLAGLGAILLGYDISNTQDIPREMWILTLVVSIFVTAVMSVWYFKSSKVETTVKEGLRFGAIILAVSFTLDLIFVYIGSLTLDVTQSLIEYYSNAWLWLTVVCVLATPTVVARYIKK